MTKAKRLYGLEKTAATRASFTCKVKEMSNILEHWQANSARDDRFWPKSLAEFAKWEDPPKGIFRWKSNNVTKRGGTYSSLVAEYWRLQDLAKRLLNSPRGTDRTQAIKQHNQALIQQNTKLIWSVMELRDALSRVDPKNEALTRLSFP